MKKFILFLVILGTAFFNIYSQQSNATLIIRGNVPVIVNVAMQESAQAQNLTMNSPGTYNIEVGTLEYRSNSDFDVTVSSSNSATGFILATAGGEEIPYTLKVDGVEHSPGSSLISQGRTFGNENIVLSIEYTISDPMPLPGDYEDVLTFNIQGN